MNAIAFPSSIGHPHVRAQSPLRVLHLEDSPIDAELIQSTLEAGGLNCVIHRVVSQADFQTGVAGEEIDLVLCDHNLPGYTGSEALKFVRDHKPTIPVIILSGSLNDEEAVQSLRNGAADYLLKERLARLVPAVRRALAEAEDRKREAATAEHIREQANLLNLTHDAIVTRTMAGKIASWNTGAEALFGWSASEAVGQEWKALVRGDESILQEAGQTVLQTGDWMGEIQLQGKTGEARTVLSRWNLLRDAQGQPCAVLSTHTDITEKKKLEGMFLRSQRMDSIGALAGGIAHDLNNALAPVLMSTELLQDCDDRETRKKFLNVIHASVGRATGMVKQLLNFAHGRNGGVGDVALGQLVIEIEKMARNVFPKSIEISSQVLEKDLWNVRGDPTELHQILLNLCVNARDAMPDGGRLTLRAENVMLDSAKAETLKGTAGPHLMISVADTGSGIPPEVLPRIFEPFFTTKQPDKGTGLGLATVAGIIRRYGGCLDIRTEVGKGTEFMIYLPANEISKAEEIKGPEKALPMGRGEMILLIEDEEAMLELAKTTLESYGYRTVTARNGVQGLDRFKEHGDEIRAVVTDTDMPQMNGLLAVRMMRQTRPELPVIIASGSKQSAEEMKRIEADRMINIGKPYSLEQLLTGIAAALD